jgi:tripartite-type tricarboxylate transporter receptor subunit TctC
MRRRFLGAALACTALSLASGARAFDEFPSRPLKIVVPYAPGGGTDFCARVLAQQMSQLLGQPVLVENKPGAATMLANESVAKAAPDGYTLLFVAPPLAMNIALGLKQPYDSFRDFEPISLTVTLPVLFAVNTATPYRSLQDVVRASLAIPAGLNYATAGVGSMPHLTGEALRAVTRANLVHIGYKGAAPALQDVLAGTVPIMVDLPVPTGTQVKAGALRGIALSSATRSPLLPDVPTVVEQGFPDLVHSAFYGLAAPANTPRPVIEKLHRTVVAALADADVRARLVGQGYEIRATSPAELTSHMRREVERWTPIVQAAGIKP